jgi:hypothetical protein
MGTRFAPMMLATEQRIRVAVLLAGAMRPVGALPEADPVNFLPRVTIPLLHVTGKYDSGYPVDLAQKPFFDLLGTSPKDKRHIILPVGSGGTKQASRQKKPGSRLPTRRKPTRMGSDNLITTFSLGLGVQFRKHSARTVRPTRHAARVAIASLFVKSGLITSPWADTPSKLTS